jgi:hypothetical protein
MTVNGVLISVDALFLQCPWHASALLPCSAAKRPHTSRPLNLSHLINESAACSEQKLLESRLIRAFEKSKGQKLARLSCDLFTAGQREVDSR